MVAFDNVTRTLDKLQDHLVGLYQHGQECIMAERVKDSSSLSRWMRDNNKLKSEKRIMRRIQSIERNFRNIRRSNSKWQKSK